MTSLSKAQMAGIVSLVALLTGFVMISNLENTYYCESEDNVKDCFRLSESGITCYYFSAPDITKGDRCVGGTWKPIENFLSDSTKVDFNSDCIRMKNKCYCNPRGLLENEKDC